MGIIIHHHPSLRIITTYNNPHKHEQICKSYPSFTPPPQPKQAKNRTEPTRLELARSRRYQPYTYDPPTNHVLYDWQVGVLPAIKNSLFPIERAVDVGGQYVII